MLKVRPPEFAAWHLTGERFDVELTLEEAEEGHTRATVVVEAPWHGALRRAAAAATRSGASTKCARRIRA